ncbi:piggyBac transposable element-derived protein 3-like [Ornithodoros turicata]|uniref:piggyBac transposable element-derived protein 3-like n=1 Tax=Ornithodoros turicata TaxID=34597 RepID=UPI00313A114E
MEATLHEEIPPGSEDDLLERDENDANYTIEGARGGSTGSSESDVFDEHEPSTEADSRPGTKRRKPQEKEKQKKKEKWQWVKKDLVSPIELPSLLVPKGRALRGETPLTMFKAVFDNEPIHLMTFESKRYRLCNRTKMKPITHNEMEVFLGMCRYMSVVHVPHRRWYWSPSTRQDTIANAVTLNRWEEILSVLHLSDPALEKKSTDPGFDRLQKVRPTVNMLNLSFSSLAEAEKCQAVDELIITFKGGHFLKVYMAKKPTKWGYKVWVRAGQTGYVHKRELHGDNLKSDPTDAPPAIGESGLIVIRVTTDVPVGTYLFFNNFFVSPPLLAYLKQRGLHSTCTMRKDRAAQCPLQSEKDLKAQGRGSYDYRVDRENGIIVCEWYDNRLVIMGSNVHGVEPLVKVKRFDRKRKEHIEVDCPALIRSYNQNMGGVDKCDMLLSFYRMHFKTKKWYKRVIFHLTDVAVVNAWLLYRRIIPDCNIQLGMFKLTLARGLIQAEAASVLESDPVVEDLQAPARSTQNRSFPVKASSVSQDVRYDRVSYFPW